MWKFWLIVIFVCLIIAAPSFIIPHWIGADVPSYRAETLVGDPEAALNLVSATKLEQRARLNEAFTRYQTATKSPAKNISTEGEAGAARVAAKMSSALWQESEQLLEFSKAGRLPSLGLAILGAVLALYSLRLKPGLEVQAFQTIGDTDPPDKVNFRQSIADQLRDVQRYFEELPEGWPE